jgi:hypothetical protein
MTFAFTAVSARASVGSAGLYTRDPSGTQNPETYLSLHVTGKSSAKPVPVRDPTVAEDPFRTANMGLTTVHGARMACSDTNGIRARGWQDRLPGWYDSQVATPHPEYYVLLTYIND